MSACQIIAPKSFDMPPQAVELGQTAFFAQDAYQCGPAALATVLNSAGLAIEPATLVDEVYVPGRRGSFQVEMQAAIRERDRVPVVLEQKPGAIFDALQAGYPVLVLQNLRLRTWPAWHYAVVVGYDEQDFILRSGTERRLIEASAKFRRHWDLAGRWALIVSAPEKIPAFVSSGQWLRAVSSLESTGKLDTAHAAYQAAARRWPDQANTWKALANTHYAKGELPRAHDALQRAVAIQPADATARNNLAQVLLELGCAGAAAEELTQISDVPQSLHSVIEQTRSDVAAAQSRPLRCSLEH